MKPNASKSLALGLGLSVCGLFATSVHAADGSWSVDAAGNWSDTTKWAGGTFADGIGSTASFGTTIANTAARTVTIDTASRTVGILNLTGAQTGTSGTQNWTIAASGGASLIFDNGASSAQLNVVNRNNTGIQAPVTLVSDLVITKTGVSNLQWNGSITAAGIGTRTVTFDALGTASQLSVVQAAPTTYTGNWAVNSGTLNFNTAWQGDTNSRLTLGATGNSNSATLLLQNSSTATAGNVITVTSGGTRAVGHGGSGAVTFGSFVLNGDLTSGTTNTTSVTLAGPSGSTITGTGGIVVAFNTTIAGAASHTGINQVTGANLTVSATGSLNGSSTAVSSGRTFTLADNATYTFDIGANGVNDAITGTGTVSLAGDFIFNLSLANTAAGNAWLIVDVNNLSETFVGTFTVANAGAVKSGNIWSFTNAGSNFEFNTLTGQLNSTSAVPEPSTYAILAGLAALGLAVVRRRRA